MGNLTNINYRITNLARLISLFKVNNFIETGTGIGSAIEFLLSSKEASELNIFSIEIMKELFDLNQIKFSQSKNVHLINDNSIDGLKHIFEIKNDKPSIFWLDAHFPGADYRINGLDYFSEKNADIRIPAKNELELIASKKCYDDIIIIDDLRIYKDGPFQNGNMMHRDLIGGDGIEFVYELFEQTHTIHESYVDEGYIFLFPKTFYFKL